MSCKNCRKQGISCPYTFMYIPDGNIPDPCPYEETSTPVSTTDYNVQIVYPEWSMTEIQKELKNWLEVIGKLSDKVSTDILVAAEAAKLIAWANEKCKNYVVPYIYTSATTELKA